MIQPNIWVSLFASLSVSAPHRGPCKLQLHPPLLRAGASWPLTHVCTAQAPSSHLELQLSPKRKIVALRPLLCGVTLGKKSRGPCEKSWHLFCSVTVLLLVSTWPLGGVIDAQTSSLHFKQYSKHTLCEGPNEPTSLTLLQNPPLRFLLDATTTHVTSIWAWVFIWQGRKDNGNLKWY